MGELGQQIMGFLKERGAIEVGFATLESLAGGPPSSDLTYILPEAKSAVSFALPLDLDEIRATLAEQERINKLMVGREGRVLELKNPRYPITSTILILRFSRLHANRRRLPPSLLHTTTSPLPGDT